MKKRIAIVMLLIFMLSALSSTAYAQEINENALSDNLQVDADIASAFGLADEITFSVNPQTDAEYRNSFLVAYLTGNWDYLIDEKADQHPQWSMPNMAELSILYSSLLGVFANQNSFFPVCIDDHYYIATNGIEPLFSKEELMQQQDQAYNNALTLYEQLFSAHTFSDEMSEKEKESKIYDLFISKSIMPSSAAENIDFNATDNSYRTIFMKYDSAYACLINNVADCGGRCAAYNLLLNIAGIKAYGVRGHMLNTDTGHILTYTILDGEEYLSDFGNRIPTSPLDSSAITSRFEPNQYYIDSARKAAGIVQISDFLDVEFSETDDRIICTCKVSEEYENDDWKMYTVHYGVDGNNVYAGSIPLWSLYEGIELSFDKKVIEQHSIPQTVFITEDLESERRLEDNSIYEFLTVDISETDDSVTCFCKLSDEFKDTGRTYSVHYGVAGNNMYQNGITLQQLYNGIELEFDKAEIERHSIPRIVFITED